MIEIINLCKKFGEKPILRNLNLTVKDGESLVIIGRSGCGKSVLLKHIVGLLAPDNGQVLVDGEDISRLSPLSRVRRKLNFGMLFQRAALFDSLTVGENVSFALREHTQMDEEAMQERVRRCLEMVGLRGVEKKKPAELSGGMQKRVGLARAIATEPEVMLYDEPTTGLDPIMADAINDLIIELQQKLKVTSIVVTHDMTSAYKVGSRIAMLYKGKIEAVGTPEEVRDSDNPILKQFVTGAAKGPITLEEDA
ncbi:MAG: ABC transporter ATP-binding protein [Candidatus Omnitrophica bacterium]|nr:ABC transporter ATP-binding protein [Candidatus Omnitrophota bacterium]